MVKEHAVKTCAACGRGFSWRKRWARDWHAVRYCSERCRRQRPGKIDVALESAVIELLQQRHGTICPSEVAQRVRHNWRDLMERVRCAGRRDHVFSRIVSIVGTQTSI